VDQTGGNYLGKKQIHLRGNHLDQIEGWQCQCAKKMTQSLAAEDASPPMESTSNHSP